MSRRRPTPRTRAEKKQIRRTERKNHARNKRNQRCYHRRDPERGWLQELLAFLG